MSKSKKRNDCSGQQSRYKIITQSAYEDRHVFKAASMMAALGLSLSAVIATMPQTVANIKTVSLDGAAAAAYVTEIPDTSVFYTDENLISFSVPELQEAAEKTNASVSPVFELDLSDFVTSISNEETQEKLDEIAAEKARIEARKKISNASSGSGYVHLNRSGVAMSEKSAPDWLTLDANGVPTNYRYCITGKATAYYSGYITSTGTRPMQGTVAVDPREIPYGTRMYITSADGSIVYGYAVAEDTGGFIYWEHGATVDLYMHSYDDCCQWGWRDANIYILD